MSSSWTPGTCKFTWLSWAPCRKSHQSHLATNPPWRWCAWMELQPGKATGTPLNCRLSVSTRICNWPPWSPVRSFIFLKNQNSLKFELRDDENANGTDRCCRPVNVTGSDWSTRQRSSHRQRHAASSALFTRMTTVAAPGDSLVAQFVSVDLDLLKETRLSRMLTSFIHSAHYRCNFNCMFEQESLKAIIFTSVNSSLNAL